MKGQKLPKEFKKYFWDVDFKKVSFQAHQDFILSRLLSVGDLPAVRWLFNAVREKTIKNFVLDHGNRQLDKRSNNFWRLFFDLPPAKRPEGAIWPY